MVEHDLSSDTRARVTRIFAMKRSYTVAEAASLLGIDEQNLLGDIERRDIRTDERDRLPWSEVAYLALRTWPLDLIFQAVGPEASSYIPELLRPTTITLMLPGYQVRAIEVLARDQQLDVSTFVQLHLLDLVSAESPFLVEQIPGFLAAFRFPFGGER